MSKAVKTVIRLLIPAGQAKPAPPVGPALGQAGLNIMGFCKDFNAKTAEVKVSFCSIAAIGCPLGPERSICCFPVALKSVCG